MEQVLRRIDGRPRPFLLRLGLGDVARPCSFLGEQALQDHLRTCRLEAGQLREGPLQTERGLAAFLVDDLLLFVDDLILLFLPALDGHFRQVVRLPLGEV